MLISGLVNCISFEPLAFANRAQHLNGLERGHIDVAGSRARVGVRRKKRGDRKEDRVSVGGGFPVKEHNCFRC